MAAGRRSRPILSHLDGTSDNLLFEKSLDAQDQNTIFEADNPISLREPHRSRPQQEMIKLLYLGNDDGEDVDFR